MLSGLPLLILVFLATIVAMEGVAYASHRWLMHGRLWCLHESHHRPRTGPFEKNDWFVVMGAVPSVALIWFGVHGGGGPLCTTVGAGMAGYGAIYAFMHDIAVHRRLPLRYRPRSAYMRRVVAGHRLHHAVSSRDGAVGFGFIYSPPPARLKRQLQENVRAGRAVLASGR